MISEFFSAFLQVLVFSLIPFIIYVIRHKKVKGFFDYIGFKRSTRRANLLALLIVLVIGLPLLVLAYFNPEFQEILAGENTMIGKFKKMGVGLSSVALLIIDAAIKTSLSEEIFFRGFLAKRLISVTNFQTGNIIQAIIFGLVHILLFAMVTGNVLFLVVIFLFLFLGAYFKTFLNEKLANGSILPGWIAHGLGNLVAYSGGAFLF